MQTEQAAFQAAAAAVVRLVAVLDRLRSAGGCPWDAEQTHRSLIGYLVEECYELVDAIEAADQNEICEELGDLLLQVVFHARIAQEHPTRPFGMAQVANGISDKMIRRHPHVFADARAATPDQVQAQWDVIKRAEKQREGIFDGIARAMPPLERAHKVVERARRAHGDQWAGRQADVAAGMVAQSADPVAQSAKVSDGRDLGRQLLELVLAADAAGIDLPGALRQALDEYETRHNNMVTANDH